jgi:prepilin-type N-terminal cleavage/methylation domain-containing protein/prepilin-type processing-associated H-X9-DG protein
MYRLFTSARNARGFTLVELLVVIAIIALLVGIMLPALQGAREMTIQTRCLAQLKQMSEALTMYAIADTNSRYPRARMMGMGNTWIQNIEQYIATKSFFHCPADISESWSLTSGARFTSYGLNGYVTHNHPPYWGMSMERMDDASATILIAEMAEDQTKDHFMPMVWGDPIAHASVLPGMMMARMNEWDNIRKEQKPLMKFRHMGKSNYGFGDGHAEAMEFDRTWSQTTGSPRTTDRYDPQFGD